MRKSKTSALKLTQADAVEIVRCGRCDGVMAACLHGLQDEEWRRRRERDRDNGHLVEVVNAGSFRFTGCFCADGELREWNDKAMDQFALRLMLKVLHAAETVAWLMVALFLISLVYGIIAK